MMLMPRPSSASRTNRSDHTRTSPIGHSGSNRSGHCRTNGIVILTLSEAKGKNPRISLPPHYPLSRPEAANLPPQWRDPRISLLLLLALLLPVHATAQKSASTTPISGQSIYTLTQQLLNVAPKRFNGSPGHLAAENFIKDHFKPEAAKGNFETDQFTANTPAGPQILRNYIVRFPGKEDGIIVLASHYETNFPLKDINFVGANDGACTTALLIQLGAYFRARPPEGYSIWLVFDDGEEAVQSWSASDSLYGTRHLAAKWFADGTDKRIKAFIVADMIGDKDLNILEEEESTPWLRAIFRQAAANTHHSANVFKTQGAEDDDHLPFLRRGVPSLDIIDNDYGPHTAASPDGYHHTAQDTIDKISPKSLQISADLFLETIRLINQRP
jgi:glutaminyl-peptide cyclotransferase